MDRVYRLFERINLEYEGLEQARALFLSGSPDDAADEIIRHFKTRLGPKYLFGKEEIERFTDKGVIARADLVMSHVIWGYSLGEQIDWRKNYNDVDFADSEWIWSLSRNLYWQPLARAYALTGDEKYAKEFAAQFKGFNDAWPVEEFTGAFDRFGKGDKLNGDHCWRTIDSAIRMYCVWLPAMEYFRGSPSLDREFWLRFINLLYDHAEFWTKYYSFHVSCSNWISMEGTALLMLGILYPEFKRSGVWFQNGYSRVTQEVRYQFDHMGSHCERTPIYHLTAAGAFLQAYRLMVRNGVTTPPYMLPILEKSGEFLMKLIKPDFTTPMLGDADRNNLLTPVADRSLYEGMNNTMDARDENEPRAFFRELAALTGRRDFEYMATGRAGGAEPDIREAIMRDQGIYVFRSGWRPENSYYWMVAGTNVERGERIAHSHYDVGHIEIQLDGEDVLTDSGRFLYGRINDPRWREYFVSSRAHNTVQVDDILMGVAGPPLNGSRTVRTFCHDAIVTDSYEFLDISHNGFVTNEAMLPVFHRRRVVHVKPGAWIIVDDFSGAGEHDYSLFFNFEPKKLTATQKYGGFRFTGDKVTAELFPLLHQGVSFTHSFGGDSPLAGWVSYGYAMKQPIHNVAYFMRGKTPARFATAFLREGCAASAAEEGGVLLVTVEIAGKKTLLEFTADTVSVE